MSPDDQHRDVPDPYLLVVHIWLKSGDVAAFETFERMAATVMAKHGGRIERAIRIHPPDPADAVPFEVHIVSFPDPDAFTRYRDDPETRRLAALRTKLIARTEVFTGRELELYS